MLYRRYETQEALGTIQYHQISNFPHSHPHGRGGDFASQVDEQYGISKQRATDAMAEIDGIRSTPYAGSGQGWGQRDPSTMGQPGVGASSTGMFQHAPPFRGGNFYGQGQQEPFLRGQPAYGAWQGPATQMPAFQSRNFYAQGMQEQHLRNQPQRGPDPGSLYQSPNIQYHGGGEGMRDYQLMDQPNIQHADAQYFAARQNPSAQGQQVNRHPEYYADDPNQSRNARMRWWPSAPQGRGRGQQEQPLQQQPYTNPMQGGPQPYHQYPAQPGQQWPSYMGIGGGGPWTPREQQWRNPDRRGRGGPMEQELLAQNVTGFRPDYQFQDATASTVAPDAPPRRLQKATPESLFKSHPAFTEGTRKEEHIAGFRTPGVGFDRGGEAWDEVRFDDEQTLFKTEFWDKQETDIGADKPGLRQVLTEAMKITADSTTNVLPEGPQEELQSSVDFYLNASDRRFGLGKHLWGQGEKGQATREQRAAIVYDALASQGATAEWIATNIKGLENAAKGYESVTAARAKVAPEAKAVVRETTNQIKTQESNLSTILGEGIGKVPTGPDGQGGFDAEVIDYNLAKTNPQYMRNLKKVASTPLNMPGGWDYSAPLFDNNGRLLSPGRLQKISEDAVDLSPEDMDKVTRMFDKQWQATDLVNRMESEDIELADDRLKYQQQTGERLGKQAWETQERAGKQLYESYEALKARDWQTAEREAGQKFKTEHEYSHELTLQGSFQERATDAAGRAEQQQEHERHIQYMTSQYDRLSQHEKQQFQKSEREAAQKYRKETTRAWETEDLDAQLKSQEELANINKEARLEAARIANSGAMELKKEDYNNQRLLQDNVHSNNMMMVTLQDQKARGLKFLDSEYKKAEATHQAVIDTEMQKLRDTGAMDRRTTQLASDAELQGKRIDHEAFQADAERMLRSALQEAQLEHAVAQLDTQGQQAMEQITERGIEDRKTLADEITSREFLAGNQITHEEAMQTADAELQKELVDLRGAEERAGIEAAGAQERETMERQFALQREQIDTATPIAHTRSVVTNYTTGLNNAITNATQSGNYETVNEALAQELPPLPMGTAWNREMGRFDVRGGFEGREMSEATRQQIAALTPAFKARDRAEQAVGQANTIQLELTAKRQDQQQANEQFRQNMLTGDIDSAEEAAARHKMAETAAIAANTKMEHVKMLFSLLQNPVQLGMAKRHGLLGQIEAVLGFTMDNVPAGPTGGAGSIPNTNEWQTMDLEEQTFSLAAYVEQGGSPDEFLRLVATSAPAQMQQVAYGVL